MNDDLYRAQFPIFREIVANLTVTEPIGVTYRGRQGYSKDIGKYVKPDGKLAPKRFWLGHDQSRAIWLAAVHLEAYRLFVAPEDGVWSQHAYNAITLVTSTEDDGTRRLARRAATLATTLQERAPIDDVPYIQLPTLAVQTAPTSVATATSATPTTTCTLYAAIAAYVKSLNGKRLSDKHKIRARQVVEVNLKKVRKDCTIATIDYAWLDSLADHFKNRPTRKDGKPMKAGGVKVILAYLRLFFTWLDDNAAAWGWNAPAKVTKPFKLSAEDVRAMKSPTELLAEENIAQFDVATLVTLYRAANDRLRAIMLTALFTGATQQELAVLEKIEFNLDESTLTHFRNKTKVKGMYWLPPELVALLRPQFAKRSKDALAFRTADGQRLVTFKDGRQTSDAVRQMWDDLRDEAELPAALTFKYLRKYLADWMVTNGGEAMGQVALSHARHTVIAKKYTTAREFAAFHALQKKMYGELKKAGMFKITRGKQMNTKSP